MIKFTIVTGNPEKLAELHRLIPDSIEFDHHNLDLYEIQSLDMDEIITDKARRAYDILQKPVLVEDVSAGLEALNGLPGPFIKFFNQVLGNNALRKLGGNDARARVICVAAYYDGQELFIGHGEVTGKVVSERVNHGFGFERVFVPDGYDQTFAEMPDELKDRLSHRGKAIRDLLPQFDR
jgi:inosine triphosphate pyrophosphatase